MPQPKRTKNTTRPKIRSECFMVCDHARVDNGKLYILGGGWDQVFPPQLPLPFGFHLAVKLAVPLDLASAPIDLRFHVQDEQGREAGGEPVDLRFDLNPPPDLLAQGITMLLGLGLDVMIAEAGRYTIRLAVEGGTIAETGFRVAPPAITIEGEEEEELDPPVRTPEELLVRDRAAGRA